LRLDRSQDPLRQEPFRRAGAWWIQRYRWRALDIENFIHPRLWHRGRLELRHRHRLDQRLQSCESLDFGGIARLLSRAARRAFEPRLPELLGFALGLADEKGPTALG